MKKQYCLFLLFTLALWAQPKSKVVLEVLGSGGPEIGDKRASSAYLVKIDGKSRILVDFGGGASLRFEEANAKIEDLDVILLTHLHIDHTADFPALLKGSFFTPRKRDLPVFGPYSNRSMPDVNTFLERLFEGYKGAWQYMGDYLDGSADFRLIGKTVPYSREVKTVYAKDDITIETVSVHHGPIPAVAYRVNIGKKSITFSGDMNGAFHTLEVLAKDTDILVAHNAVPKGATGVAAQLHMTPETIGKIAKEATPKTLILSHRMRRTLGKELETISEIRKSYKGKVKFADDGSRFLLL